LENDFVLYERKKALKLIELRAVKATTLKIRQSLPQKVGLKT